MKLFKWIRALPWAKALKAAMQVVVPAAGCARVAWWLWCLGNVRSRNGATVLP